MAGKFAVVAALTSKATARAKTLRSDDDNENESDMRDSDNIGSKKTSDRLKRVAARRWPKWR